MTRREWLLSSVAAMIAGGVRPGCQTNAWSISASDSFLAALDRIRAFGYLGYETSFRNLDGRGPQLKALIDAMGLKLIGIHIWLPEYGPEGIATADMIQRVVESGAAFGAERLILSGARASSGVGAKAAALTRAQQSARARGLGFAYHNHGPEFANQGAEIEELIAKTEVPLILDAGHAYLAGADLPGFFARHHQRIAGVHLRDFQKREQVPLGQGEVDYGALAAAVKKTAWSGWVINEEERLNNVKPGDSAVGPARAALKKLFGV